VKKHLLAAAFAGFLLASATWGSSLFSLVSLGPLILALKEEQSPKKQALLGLVAGVVHWGLMCYWVHYVMDVHGGLGPWGATAVFVLFCIGCSLGTAVFAVLAAPLLRTRWAIPGVAALWTINEWIPAPYGFTWLGLGDATLEWGPLPLLASWTGVYGLTFLIAAISTYAVWRFRDQFVWFSPMLQTGCLMAMLVLLLGAMLLTATLQSTRFAIDWWPEVVRLAQSSEQRAVIVQPNVATEQDWTPESIEALKAQLTELSLKQAKNTEKGEPSLIVWPEVPAPFYYDTDAQFRATAENLARTSGIPFLFGTVGWTQQQQPLNAAILLSNEGKVVDRYSKIELVPFGEYVPAPWASIVPKVTSEVSDFVPGSRQTTFELNGHKIATFICYESAFPDFVRRFDGEVFFNLSNDGYFGRHAAREQHLKLVRMRAIENGRWIVRATNDGITASIDPRGNVHDRQESYKQLAASLPFAYRTEQTLYRRWGDWFPKLCVLIAILCYVGAWRDRKKGFVPKEPPPLKPLFS
jgi:apolipoprotein N-acyltransferase